MFRTKNTKHFKFCMACGKQGTNGLINIKGKTVPYMRFDITIPVDVIMLGCTECGSMILGPNDCELLDKACEYIIENHPENVKEV